MEISRNFSILCLCFYLLSAPFQKKEDESKESYGTEYKDTEGPYTPDVESGTPGYEIIQNDTDNWNNQ